MNTKTLASELELMEAIDCFAQDFGDLIDCADSFKNEEGAKIREKNKRRAMRALLKCGKQAKEIVGYLLEKKEHGHKRQIEEFLSYKKIFEEIAGKILHFDILPPFLNGDSTRKSIFEIGRYFEYIESSFPEIKGWDVVFVTDEERKLYEHLHPVLIAKEKNIKADTNKLQQEQKTKSKNGRGNAPTFREIICYEEEGLSKEESEEKLLKRLHALIDNSQSSYIGAVLLRAKKLCYIKEVPKQATYKSEFKLVGSWTGIHKYLDEENDKAINKASKVTIFPELETEF